ncbi:hypothetical protein MLD38_024583 [Melastoma candidum]|uniref:Uncharacterized protein n=1 Tax=Melastoma candidum TaxID=119954 RepID=A0ACB9NT40_9MYRT|nr:hypothetical protein MLD38_024583 [Melastoma candidum]
MQSSFARPSMIAAALTLALALALSTYSILQAKDTRAVSFAAADERPTELLVIHGVEIHRNPPQSKLDELGVSNWPKWGSGPSKIPWTFESTETMYLLEGRVIVQVEGQEGSFVIGGGDLAIFPKGMKIVWEVVEPVNKHYSLAKDDEEGEGKARSS